MAGLFKKDGRKVFPHHNDAYQYYPDFGAVEAMVEGIRETAVESAVAALEKYGAVTDHDRPKALFHKMPNSFNDPITVYYVLDALVQAERGTYVRAHYLIAYLRQHNPQFFWSVGVVGRILSGFHALCWELYYNDADGYIVLPKGAEDLDEEPRREVIRKLLPFARGRDAQGRFYVLDPEGGDEGLLWLSQARKIWLDMARQSMDDDKYGNARANWGDSQAPVDYYMEHLSTRARSAQAYRNNLQGAASFKSRRPQRSAEDA